MTYESAPDSPMVVGFDGLSLLENAPAVTDGGSGIDVHIADLSEDNGQYNHLMQHLGGMRECFQALDLPRFLWP